MLEALVYALTVDFTLPLAESRVRDHLPVFGKGDIRLGAAVLVPGGETSSVGISGSREIGPVFLDQVGKLVIGLAKGAADISGLREEPENIWQICRMYRALGLLPGNGAFKLVLIGGVVRRRSPGRDSS